MKVRTWVILERAVEEGIAYGYRRAFKHDDHPDEETIKEALLNSVMSSISEVFDFDVSTD